MFIYFNQKLINPGTLGTPIIWIKELVEHNDGKSYYTKRKIPWKVIYFESSFNKMDAIAREKYLKTGMGRRYLKNRLKNQLNF